MDFHEKTHAFLAAKYYQYLTETFGDRGRQAFTQATRYYGEQRGRRMAQRAIRDGQSLTYETYCRYGEWEPTEEMIQMEQQNQGYVEAFFPDLVRIYTRCPWNAQFREMGRTDAGTAYCRDLDSAICRGFNPELTFIVERSLNNGENCVHRIVNAGISDAAQLRNQRRHLKPFAYHCAHLFWAYRKIAVGIFGQAGEAVSQKVFSDFQSQYGQDLAQVLLDHENTDFDLA